MAWIFEGNIRGPQGLSVCGKPGIPGLRGISGIDGLDGKDAPRIIDIEAEEIGKEIFFIFYFNDGSILETDRIKLPEIQHFSSSMMCATGGGGTGSSLIVQKDGVDVGVTDNLNFFGPNYTVTYDAITNTSTITNTAGLLTVLDEGNIISTNVTKVDFVGDGVEVDSTTYMADWPDLSSLPYLAWTDDGYVRVRINKSDAEFLVTTKKCSETIPLHRFVSAISGTHVALGQNNDPSKAVILGMSLEAGVLDDDIRILLFGNQASLIFAGMNVNDPFFLALNGLIASTIPLAGFITRLGTSNGDSSGFINIEQPIEI